MPRGKKNLTLEEKLDLINKRIEETKNTLASLEAQKKQFESELEEIQLKQLRDKIQENGLTIDEVIKKLAE